MHRSTHPGTALPGLVLLVVASALSAQRQFQTTRNAKLVGLSGSNYDLVAGDVDGDGDLDLVRGNDHYANQLFLNDGRGRFVDATAGRLTTPPLNATYEVDLADIDGDGDLDLLVCNDHHLPNRVHVNNGLGVFTDVSATALPPNAFWSVGQVVRDLDGDGDVDWFVLDTPTCHLYLNNGAGVFADVTATHVPTVNTFIEDDPASGDLDGDGDVDVVLADGVTVFQNQGGARFQLATRPFPRTAVGRVWLADVDRDGALDVFLGSGAILLRNLGGGSFVDVTATSLPVSANVYATTMDVDLDGDVDVVGTNILWLNDGTGRFLAANTRAPAITPSSFAPLVVDVDGDGDGDLLNGFADVHVNFLRHVDALAAPRLGQAYDVDLWVRPGFGTGTYHLAPAISFAGASIPIPTWGTFRLDPATMIPLGVHLVPPSGRFRLPYVIPANPTLLGLELHHQALVVEAHGTQGSITLSNALFDVIQ